MNEILDKNNNYEPSFDSQSEESASNILKETKNDTVSHHSIEEVEDEEKVPRI